ncbi:hypothetical protein GFD25_00955 [Bifidobacterium aerophilum]|uniref:Carboxypeptidase regulatory-like domain-containing protein n=2 Tax=Bifidobacterium aerophilum TaxID=1798155 RepID=A0A6N9Z2P5_9BIFI|nr:hypothetical protein [Bifidobacterium aerophilum]
MKSLLLLLIFVISATTIFVISNSNPKYTSRVTIQLVDVNGDPQSQCSVAFLKNSENTKNNIAMALYTNDKGIIKPELTAGMWTIQANCPHINNNGITFLYSEKEFTVQRKEHQTIVLELNDPVSR